MYKDPPSLHIGLTGHPGVGKSTVGRALHALQPAALDPSLESYAEFRVVGMRNLLEWAHFEGPPSLPRMQAFHHTARQDGRGEEILARFFDLHSGIPILDSLRHQDDVRSFHQQGGFIIALVADRDVCDKRYLADSQDQKHAETIGLDMGSEIVLKQERSQALKLARMEAEGRGPYGEGSNMDHILQMDEIGARVDANGSLEDVLHGVMAEIIQCARLNAELPARVKVSLL